MTEHTHTTRVDGCFRCDLGRDEMGVDPRIEAVAGALYGFDSVVDSATVHSRGILAAADGADDCVRIRLDEETLEAIARATAIDGDEDGCFLRVDAWNALEPWERDAQPGEYPRSDIEDCEYWRSKAKAVVAALRARAVGTE